MNILKNIIFTLLLVPAALTGAEALTPGVIDKDEKGAPLVDKMGVPVVLEWYKVDDFSRIPEMKQIISVYAEAFCDEFRTFMLDDQLQVRPVWMDLFKTLSEELQRAYTPKLDNILKLSRIEPREARVATMKDWTEEDFKDHFDVAKKPVLVIVKESAAVDKVLGFALFYFSHAKLSKDCNCVYLDTVGVLPGVQGRGFSSLLIFSILRVCPEVKAIFLDTNVWNTKAQEIYKHIAFDVIKGSNPLEVDFRYSVK